MILQCCQTKLKNFKMFEPPQARGLTENPSSGVVGQPHNPMVNSGAIMSAALLLHRVQPQLSISEKFEFITNFFTVTDSFIFLKPFLIGW